MTDERNTPDKAENPEALVSQAYRDLATECAPEELNATVLRKAAKAARPPYQRSILWTRPAAWAAVVAICLAITLQVTQVPVPDDVPVARELQESDAFDAVSGKKEQEQYRDGQLSSDRPAGRSASDSNTEGRIVPGSRSEDAANVAHSPAAAVLQEATPAMTEDFDMPDADILRRAEDLVRLQTGDNKIREHKEPGESERADVAATAAGFAAASAPARPYTSGCTEADRQDPETWLDCILSLEGAGLVDEGALQREQLAETFPDFEIPARAE